MLGGLDSWLLEAAVLVRKLTTGLEPLYIRLQEPLYIRLQDTARYAGLLLAPAEGFDLWPRGFFALPQEKPHLNNYKISAITNAKKQHPNHNNDQTSRTNKPQQQTNLINNQKLTTNKPQQEPNLIKNLNYKMTKLQQPSNLNNNKNLC